MGANPQITCDEPTHSFSERMAKGVIEHTFVLRNDGTTAVQIRKPTPACHCTIVDVPSLKIEPGGTLKIQASLRLDGLQGEVKKIITVEAEDSSVSTPTLTFSGKVFEPARADPEVLFFGKVTSESKDSREITVTFDQTRKGISNVTSDSRYFTVKSNDDPNAPRSRIVVTLVPPLPVGPIECTLRVKPQAGDVPAFDIPVSGYVLGPVNVVPQTLRVPASPQVVTRYISVVPGPGTSFEIQSVESPNDSVSTKIIPTGSSAYRLRITGPLGAENLAGKTIKVKTDKLGEVSIPIEIEKEAAATSSSAPATQPGAVTAPVEEKRGQ